MIVKILTSDTFVGLAMGANMRGYTPFEAEFQSQLRFLSTVMHDAVSKWTWVDDPDGA